MKLVTKSDLAYALGVTPRTISNKVKQGSLPPPRVGVFPQPGRGNPLAENKAMWDLEACLRAWGRA